MQSTPSEIRSVADQMLKDQPVALDTPREKDIREILNQLQTCSMTSL